MKKTFYWLNKWRRANGKVFYTLILLAFLVGLLIGKII